MGAEMISARSNRAIAKFWAVIFGATISVVIVFDLFMGTPGKDAWRRLDRGIAAASPAEVARVLVRAARSEQAATPVAKDAAAAPAGSPIPVLGHSPNPPPQLRPDG